MTTTPLDDLRAVAGTLRGVRATWAHDLAAEIDRAVAALEPVTLPPPVDVEAVTAELGPAPIYEHLVDEKTEELS